MGKFKTGLLIATVLSCLFALPEMMLGAQRGVQVRLSGQELFKTPPRNVISTTFAVTNTSDEALEFIPVVNLPRGWKLVSPSLPFRLNAQRTEIRIVSFFVPQTAFARKQKILYRVNSSKYPSISDSAAIHVEVQSVTKLQAQLLQSPENTIAGNEYQSLFSVINASNIENEVVVKVQSRQNLPIVVTPERMMLTPGESREIKVAVQTDEKLRKAFKHHLKLTVTSVEDEKMKGQASSAVDIIPRMTGKVDRYHKIQSRIIIKSLIVKGERDKDQFQGEFSGEGRLTENGNDQISFMFRGPDSLKDNSVYGERDNYFAAYRSEDAEILLGDGYYSLSKLTEQSLEGRGSKAGIVLNDFSSMGYYMKTRWGSPEETEGALHFDYLFGKKYRIGTNFLSKKSDTRNAQIASVVGILRPYASTNIELEAAYGRDNNREDNGYWLNMYGSPEWGTYSLEYIRAEPDYPGYYRDKEYLSGNIYMPLLEPLSLSATLRQEKNNLDIDLGDETSYMDRYGQVGLNYVFATGTSIALESMYNSLEDRFPNPSYDLRKLTLKARLSHNFKRAFFNVSTELGNSRDKVKNSTARVGVYEATGYFMPIPRQTFGGYIRYGNYEDPENPGKDFLDAGVTASFELGKTTRFNLRLEKYDNIGSVYGDRHTVDFSINHIFTNRWISAVKGRHTLYGDDSSQEDETALVVELTIPFGLPVGRKKSIGMLEGYVRNQETGKALPDAVLRANDAIAVTDAAGQFVFPALQPGTYSLTIDKASIGMESIPVQKTPMGLTIKGGEETLIEIGITRSAGLTGRVMVYEFAETGGLQHELMISGVKKKTLAEHLEENLVESHGLSNAIVEFSSDQDTWRVITDRKGRFSFSNLRPGSWMLSVYTDTLPPYHRLEKSRFVVELTPGEQQEMLIRVLPKKRTIMIIEEGETLIEE